MGRLEPPRCNRHQQNLIQMDEALTRRSVRVGLRSKMLRFVRNLVERLTRHSPTASRTSQQVGRILQQSIHGGRLPYAGESPKFLRAEASLFLGKKPVSLRI
jgi:hypothetical protein